MTRQPVTLPLTGGGRLTGTVNLAEGDLRVVLFVHGFGSTQGGVKSDAVAEVCGRRGWGFAAFDFRGHGGSTGDLLELRGSGLQADLDAVADFLTGRGV